MKIKRKGGSTMETITICPGDITLLKRQKILYADTEPGDIKVKLVIE